jgi:hypothetical protein
MGDPVGGADVAVSSGNMHTYVANVSSAGITPSYPLYIQWTPANNLTTDINLTGSSITFINGGGISGAGVISADTMTATQYFGSSMTLTGSVTANTFIGDGAGLTGLSYVPYSGATGAVNLGAYGISTSSNISANSYQINGVGILPPPTWFSVPYSTTLLGKNAGRDNGSDNNTFIGYAAGIKNYNGQKNTFIGSLTSGFNTTSGSDNTLLGYNVSYGLSSGQFNTILGSSADYNLSVGSYNVCVGYKSGWSNTNGGHNTLIGNNAGYTTNGGSYNILIGDSVNAPSATTNNYLNIGNLIVGDMATSSVTINGSLGASRYDLNGSTIIKTFGASSIGVGLLSGIASTANSDSFFGYGAGQKNTSGQSNTFIGHIAGGNNLTASYNTFIGHAAGNAHTSGGSNVAIGYTAYLSGNGGANSTMIGVGAGQNNSGSSNTFLGYKAGDLNTSGTGNIIIGVNADAPTNATSNHLNIGGLIIGDMAASSVTINGTLNTKAYGISTSSSVSASNFEISGQKFVNKPALHSLSVGNGAGANMTGQYNVVVGEDAGGRIAGFSGTSNVMMGVRSGYGTAGGVGNTFVGHYSGTSNDNGGQNTFVGSGSGQSNTGYYNTYLGYNAGNSNLAGQRNIVIGWEADTPTTGISDYLNIGNLIVGDIATSSVTINGNLGVNSGVKIGTSSVAVGFVHIQTPSGVNSQSAYSLKISSGDATSVWGIHPNGHISNYGAKASVTNCTNGTIDSGSRDSAGSVSFAGANTTCDVVFGSTYDGTPHCVISGSSAGSAEGVHISAISITGFTFLPGVGNWDTNDRVSYICMGAH